jgi:hypothetical protein
VDKKQLVVEMDLGREEIAAMTDEEAKDVLWKVVEEVCDDPAGLDPKYFRLCNGFNTADIIVCAQFTPRRCLC